jgi:predicted enzyme related to lactoylglutathione lyase
VILRRREFMKTSGITAALPAQDMARARAFYIDKVGLHALESDSLEASDGRVGLMVGDGVNQLFVYPARAESSGEFTQVVIQVADVRAAVEEMSRRGVEFEEYDTPSPDGESSGSCLLVVRTADRLWAQSWSNGRRIAQA